MTETKTATQPIDHDTILLQRLYLLDESGEPVRINTFDEATRERLSASAIRNSRIADDDVDGIRVSTVFLFVDHGDGEGAPVLWETMIFGGPRDGEIQRYTSRNAALAGHQALVAELCTVTP